MISGGFSLFKLSARLINRDSCLSYNRDLLHYAASAPGELARRIDRRWHDRGVAGRLVVVRRVMQQGGRASLLCRASAEVALVFATDRAVCDAFRAQPDLILEGHARAKICRIGVENAELQHFAAVGKTARADRRGNDSGSRLREARPRFAAIRRRHRKAGRDETRAAITEAAAHRDAEVCRESGHGSNYPQRQEQIGCLEAKHNLVPPRTSMGFGLFTNLIVAARGARVSPARYSSSAQFGRRARLTVGDGQKACRSRDSPLGSSR